MSSWRDAILDKFVPQLSKLSLASDPDNLLTEEKTAYALRQKGFDILEFTDAIEFRYAYESQYRAVWDKGGKTELVVILHTEKLNLDTLPFDILEAGRKCYFKLADLFPLFSPPILEILDKGLLDILYEIRRHYPKERISDNSTIDFFLKYLYKINIDQIYKESDLLSVLLHIHYSHFDFPERIRDRLLVLLSETLRFNGFPLKELLYNKDAFIEYIIENHENFLNNTPEVIFSRLVKTNSDKIKQYLTELSYVIPSADSNYREWLNFSHKFAALSSKIYLYNSDLIEYLNHLSEKINTVYIGWIQNNFHSLITIPPVFPAMVHHIPKYLFYRYKENELRKALIVIDGLALDQWYTLKDALPENNFRFIEKAAFAWVPTLTSVSRQAIFSGMRPFEYEKYINTTSNEEKSWSIFWQNGGMNSQNILYIKGIDDNTSNIESIINNTNIKIGGFIVNTIDNIMHGGQLGMEGMHNSVKLFAQRGMICQLLNLFFENNYEIWITSDHGNIDCTGIGNPNEASIASCRGGRARIYKTHELRQKIKNEYTESIIWNSNNLPKDYLPLLSNKKDAFIQYGKKSLSHGGITIQETIVPFVKVERKQRFT
jgi:hypothetical protein